MAPASGKKLLVMTNGSRGDVQPFIALGLALQKAGYCVRISTNVNHVAFMRAMGLDAVGTNADSEKMLRDQPRLRECMAKGNIVEFARGLADFNKQNFPPVLAAKMELLKSWRPDLILTTPLDFLECVAMAGVERIPVVLTGLQSVCPSKDLPTMLGEPGWFPHRMSGVLFFHIFLQSELNSKAQVIKERVPGAEGFMPTSLQEFLYMNFHPVAPVITCFSPSLQPIPPDWSEDLKAKARITGFWAVSKEEQEERFLAGDPMFGGDRREEVLAFLAAGSAPVYMGWGSMVAVSAERMACLAVRSLLRAGMRGIILGGYAGLEPQSLASQRDSDCLQAYAKENVLFVRTAPHEWLFPQCSVIVHHGGSGTTAAALRSGVPMVITPCAFDQFYHARLVTRHGVGVAMRQFSKVTPKALASALRHCTSNEGVRSKARSIAEQLHTEDGTGNAVRAIDEFVAGDLSTGEWQKAFDAQFCGLQRLKARGRPSCLAWCSRLLCSSTPNDYSVAEVPVRPQRLPTLLGSSAVQQDEKAQSGATA